MQYRYEQQRDRLGEVQQGVDGRMIQDLARRAQIGLDRNGVLVAGQDEQVEQECALGLRIRPGRRQIPA